MKVILLQDVAKTGRKLDIIEVPNGFALNQLIPKGLAKAATSENVKMLSKDLEKVSALREIENQKYESVAKELEGKTVSVKAEANEKGHLFASLKPEAVSAALGDMNIEVTPTMIEFTSPIKEVGEHEVYLVCQNDRSPFTVKVEG